MPLPKWPSRYGMTAKCSPRELSGPPARRRWMAPCSARWTAFRPSLLFRKVPKKKTGPTPSISTLKPNELSDEQDFFRIAWPSCIAVGGQADPRGGIGNPDRENLGARQHETHLGFRKWN